MVMMVMVGRSRGHWRSGDSLTMAMAAREKAPSAVGAGSVGGGGCRQWGSTTVGREETAVAARAGSGCGNRGTA